MTLSCHLSLSAAFFSSHESSCLHFSEINSVMYTCQAQHCNHLPNIVYLPLENNTDSGILWYPAPGCCERRAWSAVRFSWVLHGAGNTRTQAFKAEHCFVTTWSTIKRFQWFLCCGLSVHGGPAVSHFTPQLWVKAQHACVLDWEKLEKKKSHGKTFEWLKAACLQNWFLVGCAPV